MLTKDQMLEQYEVLGFGYGMCVVQRKADGVKGTLDFGEWIQDNGMTRYYYNFVEA
jgi:hypothetical protein